MVSIKFINHIRDRNSIRVKYMSSTEITPPQGATKLGIKDRERLRKGYEKIMNGLVALVVAMILLAFVSMLSVEYVIEREQGGVLFAPVIAVLFSTISLGDGSLKLKKPLYLMTVALLGIGFLLYSGVILLLLINPLLIIAESILLTLMFAPRLGALGLALLFLLMRADLAEPHKSLALVAALIAFVGVAVFADIAAVAASMIMIYTLYSLRKRL